MQETGFTVRQATISDARAIAQIHVQAWREAYRGILADSVIDRLDVADREERWQKILSDDAVSATAFVAEISDEFVGFIHCGPLRSPEAWGGGEVTAIYVLASAQRRGIGRSLTRAAAAFLQAAGMTRLTAWVLAENWPARQFYERLGGMVRDEKTVTLGQPMQEVAYFWEDIDGLGTY